MDHVRWTEIDGVTTAWVDTGGPLTGWLTFRTGRADETLLTSGHLHLLEHLAASSLGHTIYPFSASVDPLFSRFGASGTPEQVVAFLGGVCAGLASPPFDRMEGEKKVLAAEAATRNDRAYGERFTGMYGARSFGLLGLDEIGLPGARREDLEALARERFTSGNAFLTLTGPPPPGLRLPLPLGPRILPAVPEPRFPGLPGFLARSGQGASALAIVPRVSALPLLTELASRRLRERLRNQLGLSYSPGADWEPFSSSAAHMTLRSDSAPDRSLELADAFLDVVGHLADVEEEELGPLRDHRLAAWRETLAGRPDAVAQYRLSGAFQDWAFGGPFEPLESWFERTAAAALDDVRSVARAVQASAIFVVPPGLRYRPELGMDVDGGAAAPPVDGRVVLHRDAPVQKLFLVHGRDGVSLRYGASSRTVYFANLAAAAARGDGCVTLYGEDGGTIAVEPTLWTDGQEVVAAILERVPQTALVRLEARPPDSIPRPATTPGQRFLARFELVGAGVSAVKRLGAPGLALAVGLVLLAVWAVLSGATAILPTPGAEDFVALAPSLVFSIGFGLLVLLRKLR